MQFRQNIMNHHLCGRLWLGWLAMLAMVTPIFAAEKRMRLRKV